MRRAALALALKAADHMLTAILEHNAGNNRTPDMHGQHEHSTSSRMDTSSNPPSTEAHGEREARPTAPNSGLIGVATTRLVKFSYCSCPALT